MGTTAADTPVWSIEKFGSKFPFSEYPIFFPTSFPTKYPTTAADTVWSLKEPYNIEGQSNLEDVGNDADAVGFTSIFTEHDEVLIKTSDGSWVGDFYLPDPNNVPVGTKIQFQCESTWGFNVHCNNDSSSTVTRRLSTDTIHLNTDEEVLLIVYQTTDTDGTMTNEWLTEDEYEENGQTEYPSSSVYPSTAPHDPSEKDYYDESPGLSSDPPTSVVPSTAAPSGFSSYTGDVVWYWATPTSTPSVSPTETPLASLNEEERRALLQEKRHTNLRSPLRNKKK